MKRILCNIRPGFSALAQLSAKWFHAVTDALNNMSGKNGIRITDKGDGGKQVELDIPAAKQALSVPETFTGDIVDKTDSPSVLDTNGDSWTWKAGGANGLEMDCYCKLGPQQSGAVYSVFQRVRMTISKDGLVVKAELLNDRIRLQAKNG